MPIGYLITTGLIAWVASAAVWGIRPRRSSPFSLRYSVAFLLNWPLAVFVLLVASTVLAIMQSGVGSAGFWIGLALAIIASAELLILSRRARATGRVIERALDAGLGAGWRSATDAELVDRLRRHPSLARIPFAPISFRRHGVERVANIRYGPARRDNLLDLYRDRSGRLGRPTLIYVHARVGSKRFGARQLLDRLAREGWVCVSANYRLSDPLIDMKRVIAWVREHGPEYDVDQSAVFVAGSSLGGQLALQSAVTDTSIAGAISLYAYYGRVDWAPPPAARFAYPTTNAPLCFVAHGQQDNLVLVEDARAFVEQLRATSPHSVVYAELPGALHGFDLFRSRRFDIVVDGIEAFTAHVLRHRERN
jgi:acetyl esterase/lipase